MLTPFLFAMSSTPNEIFQVITAHPEILKELFPDIQTLRKENRLWLVKVTGNPYWKTRSEVLRPVKNLDLRTYRAKPSLRQEIADPAIVNSLSKLDQKNIQNDIVWLASYKTRFAGSSDNRDAYNRIFERFKVLGFQVSLVCYRQDICSVIANLPGQGSPDKIVLVMGHVDSVGKEFAGADDNASGVAVILEMARVLSGLSHDKSIRFLITNGEETGLFGADQYAQKLEDEGTIQNIEAAINMDMVSYNSNGIVELETNTEFESLAQQFAGLASTYTNLKSKITLGAWGSDHVPFLNRKVPTVLTIEDWETKTPCYHQACDLPNTVNYAYALEIAKLNLSAVLHFSKPVISTNR